METKAKTLTMFTIKVKEVEQEWFTSSDACKYLGVKPRTLRDLRSSGKLKFYSFEPDNIYARVYMKRRDLDRLLKPVTL